MKVDGTFADGVTRGMELTADFLEREADANFMPNEPAKVLLKTFAMTIRRNLAISELTSAQSARPEELGTGALRELVAKWREREDNAIHEEWFAEADAYKRCADELEAALAASSKRKGAPVKPEAPKHDS